MNNVAATGLEQLGVHTLYRVRWGVIAPVSVGISLATLMLVAMLAATRGRLYCNTVCPVGALLGLLSKISFLRISIDPGACKGCKLCEGVCKAGCIDGRIKTVDISRCVGCYNLNTTPSLRWIRGFERVSAIPSESTFSRAFAEFAKSKLCERVHEAMVEKSLKTELIRHISRDTGV